MQSYAKWSEAPLIGTTETVLIELGGPMPKNAESQKKPWYCKLFQSGQCQHTKNHEFGGKI